MGLPPSLLPGLPSPSLVLEIGVHGELLAYHQSAISKARWQLTIWGISGPGGPSPQPSSLSKSSMWVMVVLLNPVPVQLPLQCSKISSCQCLFRPKDAKRAVLGDKPRGMATIIAPAPANTRLSSWPLPRRWHFSSFAEHHSGCESQESQHIQVA